MLTCLVTNRFLALLYWLGTAVPRWWMTVDASSLSPCPSPPLHNTGFWRASYGGNISLSWLGNGDVFGYLCRARYTEMFFIIRIKSENEKCFLSQTCLKWSSSSTVPLPGPKQRLPESKRNIFLWLWRLLLLHNCIFTDLQFYFLYFCLWFMSLHV